jgi:hypothetical protein
MHVDQILKFKDKEIHNAALYCLNGLMKAQFPNGAWPQGYSTYPDPAKYPVKKANYPDQWSREYPGVDYTGNYTFNDNTMSDVVTVMLEAYKIYGNKAYLNSAEKCGDFMILAQMPEPQPAWAQQYNADMQPCWARKFEPPAITGGESFGVMRTLINLYLNTGEKRFLEPIPKALVWAKRSMLPDGRMARFYELKTNRPLYFNAPRIYSNLKEPAFPDLKDYTLIYEDTDLPNHYSFKVSGEPVKSIETLYNKALKTDRNVILAELAEKEKRSRPDAEEIGRIIAGLNKDGAWIEKGKLQTKNYEKYIEAEIISVRTFNTNIEMMAEYLKKR